MNTTVMIEGGLQGVAEGSDLTPEEYDRLVHVQAFRKRHHKELSGEGRREERRRRRRRRAGAEGGGGSGGGRAYLSEMPAEDEVGVF